MEKSSIDSTFYNRSGKVESTALQRTLSLHFSPIRLFTKAVENSSIDSTFHNGSGKVESTSLYRTFSLHFSPTRLFTTSVETSSLPHFTALSHFTSLRLDFLQWQWKSRVHRTSPHFLTSLLSDSTFYNGSGEVESTSLYRTFSLHFSPTRLFTTAVEKSSLPHFTALSHFTSLRLDFLQRQWKSRVYRTLPHFLTSLLSDSTFYNVSGNVESTSLYRTFSLHFSPTRLFTMAVEESSPPHLTALSHFTSLRLDILQRQWKSRVYLILPHFLTSLLSDSTFYNGSGKVEYRLDLLQPQWKSRVYRTLPHFLTSLLSDSTFYNGSGKVESTALYRTFSLHFSPTRLFTTSVETSSLPHFTALSHFTSLRLDFLQWQWKSRVHRTSPHFLTSLPLRLDILQRQWKSRVYLILPHFLTSLLSDSTFYNGSGKVEYRLDLLQPQWKSRVYLTLPHFLTPLLSDSTFYNGSGKVESTSLYRTFSLHFSPTQLFATALEKSNIDSTFYNRCGKVESNSLSHFTSLRLDILQQQWKIRV